MTDSKATVDEKLGNLSGAALELVISEYKATSESAVDANQRLRDETQHIQSIAALVISLMVGLSASFTAAGRVMMIIAIVLLIVTILSSLVFLFNRPPRGTEERILPLLRGDQPNTVDSIHHHQLAKLVEDSRVREKLLRERTLHANLIKAGLAGSVVFIACGLLIAQL